MAAPLHECTWIPIRRADVAAAFDPGRWPVASEAISSMYLYTEKARECRWSQTARRTLVSAHGARCSRNGSDRGNYSTTSTSNAKRALSVRSRRTW